MIEVVIDFKDIKTQEDLVLLLREKLGLPYKNRVGKWDAFRDNFSDIFCKIPPKDYVYKDNDEWEWHDHYDYVECVRDWSEIGPKDENGEKGDMKFIFKNFHQFSKRNYTAARTLLEIIWKEVDGKIIPNQNVFTDEYYLRVEIDGVLMDSSEKWSIL
jgi:RNAse (barnase) inhibitor barstar